MRSYFVILTPVIYLRNIVRDHDNEIILSNPNTYNLPEEYSKEP